MEEKGMEMYLTDYKICDKNMDTCQIHYKRKIYEIIMSVSMSMQYIFYYIKGVNDWLLGRFNAFWFMQRIV